jgi:predicted DNA-binding ribbon-helix-helix protein
MTFGIGQIIENDKDIRRGKSSTLALSPDFWTLVEKVSKDRITPTAKLLGDLDILQWRDLVFPIYDNGH